MIYNKQSHRLYEYKSRELPRHLFFLDTESNQRTTSNKVTIHTLKLGWCCYYRPAEPGRDKVIEWFRFTDNDSLWSWIYSKLRQKQKYWFIAHNWGFDFPIIRGADYLLPFGFECKMFYASGKTTYMVFSKAKIKLCFIDSMNHFLCKLETLGEYVGRPKGKVDFHTVSFEKLSEYCKNDVQILIDAYEQYFQFLKDNDFGGFGGTKGSQAFRVFRYRFLKHDIFIHHNERLALFERSGYFGGRTECFFIGKVAGPVYHLDINSQYPSVMAKNYFPIKATGRGLNLEVDKLRELLQTRCVMAKVIIKTDKPVFPLRSKRLLFPVGRFVTTLNTPELQYALKSNNIEQVLQWSSYKRGKIFTGYVNCLYKLKQKYSKSKNLVYRQFVKDMLNALYGKFGQKIEQWVEVGKVDHNRYELIENYVIETGQRWYERTLFGKVEEKKGFGEGINTFVPVASHVTAYGRLKLWEYIQLAGRENIFYCDTDSLLVNEKGYVNLQSHIDAEKLGSLALVSIYDEITVHNLKDYVFGGKVKIKSIKATAIRMDVNIYQQEQWQGLLKALSNKIPGTVQVIPVVKHLSREYQKGIVTASGAVQPYQFDYVDGSFVGLRS